MRTHVARGHSEDVFTNNLLGRCATAMQFEEVQAGRPADWSTSHMLELRLLDLQQLLLALHAPAVSCHRAITADDSMARNHNRYRIGSARPRYGTHCGRLTDLLSDLGICARLAARNPPQ